MDILYMERLSGWFSNKKQMLNDIGHDAEPKEQQYEL